MTVWATGTPIFLTTVESLRSLCSLEIGSFDERCSKMALAIPRLPSEFSKSIGFVWHGRRSDLAWLDLLFEIVHRYV
jgi:hypothetical protein